MLRPPDILKNTQFLKLWGNQLLLQVGFNMCNYTALLIIASRTHSVFAQSMFYAALTIPAFLIGLIAGPVVDMVERKRLMLVSNFLLAVLFLMYIFTNGNLAAIMLIAFLTSSVARFFIPAEAATIPAIVDKKNLDQANAFFLFTLMGSVLLGYSLAGPIIQAFGGLGTKAEEVPFFLGSILLVIAFLILYRFKRVEIAKPRVPKGVLFKKVFYLLAQTLKEIKTNKRISLPIVLLVFVELVVGILSVSLLEYVRRFLQLPLTSVSIVLIAPLIIGIIIGILLLSEIEKRYGHRLSIYLACIGLGLLFFMLGTLPLLGSDKLAIVVTRIFTIAASFLFGILAVVITVQARTILQTSTKLQMQGRVFSILDIMIATTTAFPVLVLGYFADKISLLAMLLLMGIGVVVATILGERIVFRRSPHATT